MLGQGLLVVRRSLVVYSAYRRVEGGGEALRRSYCKERVYHALE